MPKPVLRAENADNVCSLDYRHPSPAMEFAAPLMIPGGSQCCPGDFELVVLAAMCDV